MSVTRIIAQSCRLCSKPIVEDSGKPDEAWILLADKWAAHLSCADRATKARAIQEEKAPD